MKSTISRYSAAIRELISLLDRAMENVEDEDSDSELGMAIGVFLQKARQQAEKAVRHAQVLASDSDQKETRRRTA